MVELLFAIALSGAVVVLINARYKTTELTYVVENADLKFLFTTDRIADYVNFVELLYGALPGLEAAEDPACSDARVGTPASQHHHDGRLAARRGAHLESV